METQFESIARAREARFNDILPNTTDLSLLVLKGHLLVEEVLDDLLTMSCEHREALDGIEVSFFLKARLVRALLKFRYPDWMWQMVDSLNSLRNVLVHTLDSPKLGTRVDRFVSHPESTAAQHKRPSSPDAPGPVDHAQRVRAGLAYLLGALSVMEIVSKTGELPPPR